MWLEVSDIRWSRELGVALVDAVCEALLDAVLDCSVDIREKVGAADFLELLATLRFLERVTEPKSKGKKSMLW